MAKNDEGVHRAIVGEGDDAVEVVLNPATNEVELWAHSSRGGVLRLPLELAPHVGEALIHAYSVKLEGMQRGRSA